MKLLLKSKLAIKSPVLYIPIFNQSICSCSNYLFEWQCDWWVTTLCVHLYSFIMKICVHSLHSLPAYLGLKKLSFCHKLWFSNPVIFATRCCRFLIFQTMNCDRSSSLSLKYQRNTPSGCKYIGIRKFECVAKTQFFWRFKPEWRIKQSI